MNRKSFFVAALISVMALAGCQKETQTTPEPEVKTNFFTYDGYSFDINSAARIDKGDNTVELWLSPDKGLTTMADYLASGDYLAICTHKSYLGTRDRFTGQASKNSFIRFADKEFKSGQDGTAYIEANIANDSLKLDFLAEKMYTRSAVQQGALISGTYAGLITEIKEEGYANEWGFNMERADIKKVTYIEQEDGSGLSIIIADDLYNESLNITITPDLINKILSFSNDARQQGVSVTYYGGVEFDLTKALGSIQTELKDNNLSVKLDLTNSDFRVRANYNGAYTYKLAKLNRYIFDSGTTSALNGRTEIVKLMVKDAGDNTMFYLSPNLAYTTKQDYTYMPILTVPDAIINAGKTYFKDIKNWDFKYDMMQVGPFESTEKPYPADNDWVEISFRNGIYEVDVELTGNADGLPKSSIDLFYKGKATE